MTQDAGRPSGKMMFAGGTAVGIGALIMLLGGGGMLLCRGMIADADSMVGVVGLAFVAAAVVLGLGAIIAVVGVILATFAWLRGRPPYESG